MNKLSSFTSNENSSLARAETALGYSKFALTFIEVEECSVTSIVNASFEASELSSFTAFSSRCGLFLIIRFLYILLFVMAPPSSLRLLETPTLPEAMD